jgi:hypothetical protein
MAGIAAVVAAAAAGPVGAQSSIGTQGFGYPPGQLSTRAFATGGAIAEVDPWSPVNPSSLAMLGGRILFFQIEPEYRKVTLPTGSDRTTQARYPLVLGAMRGGENWVIGVSASTLLDRTSRTETITRQLSGADSMLVTTTFSIDGAVNDLRLAAGWQALPWLRVGAGLHAFTGRNLVTLEETFSDTTSFVGFQQARDLSFSGGGVSFGGQFVSKLFLAAASYRVGGSMHLTAGDTLLGDAGVPSKFGASIAYVGSTNTTIAIRTSFDGWSALNGLGSPGLRAQDTWDSSIGADIAGPRVASRPLMLRVGARLRDLPFEAAGRGVTERSVMAGLGTFWAQGHLLTDLAVIRADRDAGLPASEQAWTLSIGVTIRP